MSEKRLTLAALGEIEQRAGQATEGPWIVDGAAPGEMGLVMVRPEHGDYVTAKFHINRAYANGGWDNAEFIAHSRHDVPTLTAELRRAWEALAEIEQIAGYYAMGFYCQWCDKLVPEKELVHHDNCPHFLAHKALPEDWPR